MEETLQEFLEVIKGFKSVDMDRTNVIFEFKKKLRVKIEINKFTCVDRAFMRRIPFDYQIEGDYLILFLEV